MDFDPQKDQSNRAKHGVSLADADRFELIWVMDDVRRDYGERRRRAFGFIDGAAHVLVYVIRDDRIRPISLRRAHAKEIRKYGL
ncbi:MAG: BrnT family toxin [Brevundimonas sp.]|nr:MAG: BrnT family toxin [Brevundimonas sp.]